MKKKEILRAAAFRYAIAYADNMIWQRENSTALSQAKGYIDGICTVYELDYEVIKTTDKEEVKGVIFTHQRSGRKCFEVDAGARL